MSVRSSSDGRRGLWRSRWAAIGAAVAITLGGGGIFVAQAASSPPSSVITIDPVRILDTRTGVGLVGPFVSAVPRKLQVTGPAVPIGATGVLLNVTVVAPSVAGFLSVRPGDATDAPSTSSLNFTAGDIVPNSVQVGLPTAGANAGQIDITYDAFGAAGPTTDVLIDAVGYLTAGGAGTPGPAGPQGPAGEQGPAGTPAPTNLLPVAYGRIDYEANPIEFAGVGVNSVARFNDVYDLRLSLLYDNQRLSTVVTPEDCEGTFPSITTYAGNYFEAFARSVVQIRFIGSGGTPTRCSFSFVVYYRAPG